MVLYRKGFGIAPKPFGLDMICSSVAELEFVNRQAGVRQSVDSNLRLANQ
jgi:hypothetical protein